MLLLEGPDQGLSMSVRWKIEEEKVLEQRPGIGGIQTHDL